MSERKDSIQQAVVCYPKSVADNTKEGLSVIMKTEE